MLKRYVKGLGHSAIWAKFVLALFFFRRLLMHFFVWFRIYKKGEHFFQVYSEDGILPVGKEKWRVRLGAQRCLNCSFCSFGCIALKKREVVKGFEPKQVILWYSKSSHEVKWVGQLACLECVEECKVECPVGVPIHKVISLLRQRQQYFLALNREGKRGGVVGLDTWRVN